MKEGGDDARRNFRLAVPFNVRPCHSKESYKFHFPIRVSLIFGYFVIILYFHEFHIGYAKKKYHPVGLITLNFKKNCLYSKTPHTEYSQME